jgi:hypothetical protein
LHERFIDTQKEPYTMKVESHIIPSVSDAALAQAAKTVVANAVSTAFNEDPVIGPDLSRAIAVVNSVVKRHGHLLESTLANALAASGRFDVLVEVAIPVTDAAQELLLARNSAEDLARINIRADASAERIVTIDLVVIDAEVGWAGAYEIKRGNGAIDGRSRRPIENDLKATRMVLSSYLAKRGYPNIARVTTGVIDYYGGTGFSKELKIGRDDLDSHFGVPVRQTLDRSTTCLRTALHSELPYLFATVLDAIGGETVKQQPPSARTTVPQDDHFGAESALIKIINARPTGPGPRSRQ